MLIHFATALVMALLCIAFIFGAFFAGKFLRPKSPSAAKAMPYECGEPPQGPGWLSFNIRFYQVALLFVIFDVEAALMFPVAAAIKRWTGAGMGLAAFIEIALFAAILIAGLAYCWAKGDLDWVKKIEGGRQDAA